MGSLNGPPRAREPGISLEVLVSRLRAEPRSTELELALADFLMLPVSEQMEILFLAVVQHGNFLIWVREELERRKAP